MAGYFFLCRKSATQLRCAPSPRGEVGEETKGALFRVHNAPLFLALLFLFCYLNKVFREI